MSMAGPSIRRSVLGICSCVVFFVITIVAIFTFTLPSIGCNEIRSGHVRAGGTVYFRFTNPVEQHVTFTNCDSSFDTVMYLKDSEGNNIQGQSMNECDGDDCWYDSTYRCNKWDRETFTMKTLAAGNYIIGLGVSGYVYNYYYDRILWPWWNETYSLEVMCHTTPMNIQYDIKCGEIVTGNLTDANKAILNFTNAKYQSATFTNCDSNFDTVMYLKDSAGNYIQSQSTNNCYGNDCYDATRHCNDSLKETFTMNVLAPGQYVIELGALLVGDHGTFVVDVMCNKTVNIQHDIKCGETITGNLTVPNKAYLNFTNHKEQSVIFTNCDSDFDSVMYLMDSSGNYIQSQSTNNCDGNDCYDPIHHCNNSLKETFTMHALAPGNYIIELDAFYEVGGGTFVVAVVCNTTANTQHDIECGETITGNLSYPHTASFNFNNSEQQDVVITNCQSDPEYDTKMRLRDWSGNYIHNQSTNRCDGDDCSDSLYCDVWRRETFVMDALSPGLYTIEFVSEYHAYYGGNVHFAVTVICPKWQVQSIECGESITVFASDNINNYLSLNFTNAQRQDVSFEIYLGNATLETRNLSTLGPGTYHFEESLFLSGSGHSQPVTIAAICNLRPTFMSTTTTETTRMSNSIAPTDLCEEYDYVTDTHVQSQYSHFAYECSHHLNNDDALFEHYVYQLCRGEDTGDSVSGNFHSTELSVIEHNLQTLADFGLGIQSNILLLSLLFVNVSAAIFIIFGINQLSLDIDKNTAVSIIAVTQLLLFTSFLTFILDQFGSCHLTIAGYGYGFAPTVFHFVILSISGIFCVFWNVQTKCCASWCCGCTQHHYCLGGENVFIFLAVFILPIFYWVFLYSVNARQMEYPDLGVGLFFLFFQSVLPLFLCKLTARCQRCNQCAYCRCILCVCVSLSFVVCIVLVLSSFEVLSNDPSESHGFGMCSIIGGVSWFNPFFMFCSFYLLFSQFWALTIFHNVILLIIFVSDFFTDAFYFCSAVVNVQYIAHSFLIPIYIFVFFRSLKQLRPFTVSLIGIYLVSFDVWTDFVVVYYFIDDNAYIFATLQLLFIVTGQVVGAIVDVFGDESKEVTRTDKVMALLGFGRIWFTVNWWKERMTQDGTGRYKVLRQKHRIWDLLYDSFPTVALQIYAAWTSNTPVAALTFSITISTASLSFSTILYLATLLAVGTATNDPQKGQAEPQQEDVLRSVSLSHDRIPSNESMFASPKPVTRPKGSESLYLNLFIFMTTDFVARTIPTVLLLALISTNVFDGDTQTDSARRLAIGISTYGSILIFEFFANYKMRSPSHRGFIAILKIFATSTFSSFHTMLCTLSILEQDPFYAKSVIFSKYMVGHGIRIAVAIIFCIICLGLTDFTSWYPWVLTALFMVSVICNGLSMKRIYELEAIETIKQHIVSENHLSGKEDAQEPAVQSVELQTMEIKQSESEEIVTLEQAAAEMVSSEQAVNDDTLKVEHFDDVNNDGME